MTDDTSMNDESDQTDPSTPVSLVQGLTGVIMQLEAVEAMLDADASRDEVQARIRRALELSRQNLEAARDDDQEAQTPPLEGESLVEALGRLVREHPVGERCEVTFRESGNPRPLPGRVETALVHLAQQALAKVERQGRADRVDVELALGPEQVELVIQDDGAGFDVGPPDAGGSALVEMQERVRKIGGELAMESGWTQGTTVRITVPVERR